MKTTVIVLAVLIAAGAVIKQAKSPSKGDGAKQTLTKMNLVQQYHCDIDEITVSLGLYNKATRKSKIIFTTDSFIVAELDSGDAIFVARNGVLITPIVLLKRLSPLEQEESFENPIPPKVVSVDQLSAHDAEIISAKLNSHVLWPKTIRKTAKGWYVTSIQTMLNKYGFAVAVTDSFDRETEIAVKNFQRNNKLGVDGIVGPETLRLLSIESKQDDAWVPSDLLQKVVDVKDSIVSRVKRKQLF